MKMAKTVSWDFLKGEGWKSNYKFAYLGNARHPDSQLSHFVLNNVLGKFVQILRADRNDENKVVCLVEKREIILPTWVFEKYINTSKLPKPKEFKIDGSVARYDSSGKFDFPCQFSELEKAEAIKLAKWVIRVTKK